MQMEKRLRRVASPCFDRALVRSLDDPKQQIDHQVAPEQPRELLGEVCRAAIDQSGGARLAHDVAQRGPTRLSPKSIERPRHFGRLDRLGDRQPETATTSGSLTSRTS